MSFRNFVHQVGHRTESLLKARDEDTEAGTTPSGVRGQADQGRPECLSLCLQFLQNQFKYQKAKNGHII